MCPTVKALQKSITFCYLFSPAAHKEAFSFPPVSTGERRWIISVYHTLFLCSSSSLEAWRRMLMRASIPQMKKKGATERVWASLRGAHWLPNMKKAIIIRRKWVEVRHGIPTRGESGKVSAVMCLIVKWVGPITAAPRCAQGEKWSRGGWKFFEFVVASWAVPAMNLQVVSWDPAERGHKQQGLHPNVMSSALVCTQPCW